MNSRQTRKKMRRELREENAKRKAQGLKPYTRAEWIAYRHTNVGHSVFGSFFAVDEFGVFTEAQWNRLHSQK